MTLNSSAKNSHQKQNNAATKIKICQGMSCGTIGKWLLERAEKEVKNCSKNSLSVEGCPCMGRCANYVNVAVEKDQDKKVYSHMDQAKTTQLIQKLAKE